MYTLIAAIGVKKGVSQRWQPIETATLNVILVKDLYLQYRKVYLTLESGTPAVTYYLDTDTIRPTYGTYENTIAQLLIDNGNTTLPTVSTLPNTQTKEARYMDAFRAGYSVEPHKAGYNGNAGDKPDALLSRASPPIDYTTFYNTTLVSINGLYHRTDTDTAKGIVVYGAGESLKKSNQNQIGLLTFHGMCTLQTHTITADMITPLAPGEPLSNGLYITTDVDLTDKSILFVISGYMHTLSDLVTRVSDSAFRLDVPNYPLFDRYYEIDNHLNTDDFNLSTTPLNDKQLATTELKSDENIIALLTMSQSFIVALDCPSIFTEVNYVRKTGFPGCYIAYTDPKYPLVTGLGRHNEYWYRQEDDQYILTVYDNAVSNRIYNTVDPHFQNSIGDSELPTDPVYLSGAYFMMIARDI